MMPLSGFPGFRILKNSKPSHRQQSARNIGVILFFTLFPQLIGLLLFVLNPASGFDKLSGFLYGQLFEHDELLISSVALLAPVYLLVLRDDLLPERIWLGVYSFVVTFASAIMIELFQLHQSTRIPLIVMLSLSLFFLTLALLYAVGIISLLSPADIGRDIDRANHSAIAKLSADVDKKV